MQTHTMVIAASRLPPPSGLEVCTKGEAALPPAGPAGSKKPPRVEYPLPACLRREQVLRYDPAAYDLRGATADLLSTLGAEFGSFSGPDRRLEEFRLAAANDVFRSFKDRQVLHGAVRGDAAFLDAYERLVEGVILPHLRWTLVQAGSAQDSEPVEFLYQHPPTMRVQPGPSPHHGRPHRDAEYGHQDGEVNFWLPLTSSEATGVVLWAETTPGAGDFHPLEVDVGDMALFHGSLCNHYAPENQSTHTRISLDFRIAVGRCFDAAWEMAGLKAQHTRRSFTVGPAERGS